MINDNATNTLEYFFHNLEWMPTNFVSQKKIKIKFELKMQKKQWVIFVMCETT